MLEKLEIDFKKQGYFVTFGLAKWIREDIIKYYPKAQPVQMLSIGYKDVKDDLEPYRTPITQFLLPLLTGLSDEQIKEIKEIKIFTRSENKEYLKIVTPYVEA